MNAVIALLIEVTARLVGYMQNTGAHPYEIEQLKQRVEDVIHKCNQQ